MVQYSELIRFMDESGFSYHLPKKEDLDEKNPLNKVLCLGIILPNPEARLAYTSHLFNLGDYILPIPIT